MSFDLRRAAPARRAILWWALAVPATLFAILAICVGVGTDAVIDLDHDVAQDAYDYASRHGSLVDFLDVVAVAFSNLGAAIVLVLLAAYALWRHERRVAIWIAASGIVAIVGNALIKLAYERDRPIFDKPLHEIGGYSFPSGHSSGAGMLFTVAILLTIVLTGRGWKRRILITLLVLMALGVGASRIFLGVHYLSDVVAGLSFGTAVALGLWIVLVSDATR